MDRVVSTDSFTTGVPMKIRLHPEVYAYGRVLRREGGIVWMIQPGGQTRYAGFIYCRLLLTAEDIAQLRYWESPEQRNTLGLPRYDGLLMGLEDWTQPTELPNVES